MNWHFIALSMVFLPLFASAIVGLTSRFISHRLAGVVTSFAMVVAMACAWILFWHIHTTQSVLHIYLFKWFFVEGFQAFWAIYIDMLTVVMLILVTTVSAMVHIYSIGYMSHDDHVPRFMSYLSLFTFCMMMLVCADNLLQLFFGWEGVGVCSYLLISFWYHKPSANNAAMKAFLVNRVGDFGLALGVFLAFCTFGTVEYIPLFKNLASYHDVTVNFLGWEVSAITLTCLLLFMGAMGKSAQLGLHTWLPDAMEGPTPVSALIHAATMVTAGVFMVIRCAPLFNCSPVALSFITVIGGITCIFAASVALVQNDIKRIIAYSTCSQLGYMFFACGLMAYSASIFHLVTHGFFKALLFLSAGSVIHALEGEQDITKMGGIHKQVPYTHALMWIGSLALAGIFPFAGFYSKDMILEAAYHSNDAFGKFAYITGMLAAIMTAFYSWRLLVLTFYKHNKSVKQSHKHHAHESPAVMLIPLIVLAIGAIGSGYMGVHFLPIHNGYTHGWSYGAIVGPELENPHVHWFIHYLPMMCGVAGILLAYRFYYLPSNAPAMLCARFPKIYKALQHKWYFDEIYDVLWIQNAKRAGQYLWKNIDIKLVDAVPNGAASIAGHFSRTISFLQNGYVYHYAFAMLFGLITLLTWLIFLR